MRARVCVCVPDGVVEGQVFLSELRLRAQRQVDLHVAVLHPLGWKVTLGLCQHGGQRHALRHGLLVVTAHMVPQISDMESIQHNRLSHTVE